MKRYIIICTGLFFSFSPTLVKSMHSDDSESEGEKPRHMSQKRKPLEKKQPVMEKRKAQEKEGKGQTSKKAKKEEVRTEEKTHRKAGALKSYFISKEDVELVSGKGSKKSGGGPGGHYWNIFANGTRAGRVFINWINEEPLGEHASIQIYLNKASQGKHIGRYAYGMACEFSRYDTVYAYMSKKNMASFRSAKAAGFVQILAKATAQVIMQWTRKKKE